APQWAIQPCHAQLHRTAEYPQADYKLFQDYPYPLSGWVRRFRDGTKIGGSWELRGELPNPADIEDAWLRRKLPEAWDAERVWKKAFICTLGSIQATRRQPFANVEKCDDVAERHAPPLL